MPENKDTFDIGLVMAGAISAGAYTAGVMDFLIEALDQWQLALDEGTPDTPQHNVCIQVMSGASAGGMTAAMTAAAMGGDFAPVRNLPPSGSNTPTNSLYKSWVQRIDMTHFLKTTDLEADDANVVSALDSSELVSIAEDAVKITPTQPRRRYISDSLAVMLTVTNLRGIPYGIDLAAGKEEPTDEETTRFSYQMTNHADTVCFVVSAKDPNDPASFWLNPADYTHDNWKILTDSALATGAFPLGLAPRELSKPVPAYAQKTWQVPIEGKQNNDGSIQCAVDKPIDLAWNLTSDDTYPFISVDGGVLNNEPLELARKHLARATGGRNPRDPDKATAAVLMIDPFPSEEAFNPDYDPGKKNDLISVAGGLIGALKNQGRFKAEELLLAQDDNVYSRFMIAPTRRESDEKLAKYPIASSALGGFGGFLSEDFRSHDFMLGRRNCQQFLKTWFGLPKAHPIFEINGVWSAKMDDLYSADMRDGHRPLIPLVGTAHDPVPVPSSFPSLGTGRRA